MGDLPVIEGHRKSDVDTLGASPYKAASAADAANECAASAVKKKARHLGGETIVGDTEFVLAMNLPITDTTSKIDVDTTGASPYKAASAADAATEFGSPRRSAKLKTRRASGTAVGHCGSGKGCAGGGFYEPKPSASRIVKLKQAM